jgi:choline dehydrogenase-like flavoprotein
VSGHVSYRGPGERALEADFDFVVVGSGAGGATAAVTLARAGRSVCLVEAGAWRDPEHYPSSAWGAQRDLMDDFGAQVTRGGALWPIVQARTMGGTTVINSAICVRTPGDVFSRWEKEHGVTGLEADVMAAQDVIEQELSVEEVPEAAMGRHNHLAEAGARKLGWHDHPMRRYVKGCEGSGFCLQGCKRLRKQSTNITYVPEVLVRGGTVVSSAPVERVLFEGARAVGVSGRFAHPQSRAKGAPFLLRARRAVVLAASVTHTPIILMRSGLKQPALGKYFRCHPGTGVFGVYDEPVDMNRGATQGWASTAFREKPGLKLETLSIPLELVASRLSGGGVELMKRLAEYRHITMWCHAVRAESAGTIARGLFTGKPVVTYQLDRADMERFREGMKLLAQQHFAAGARRVIPGIAGLPYSLTADEVKVLDDAPLDPKRYIAILSHLFGGCVMGRDERTSVTDANGRVHGLEGLVIADASVIPTNLGVNPQHTIMGLARTFASRLVA